MVVKYLQRPRFFTAGKPSLCRISYASELLAVDAQEAEKYLALIMASALKNNPAMGITGMLYYDTRTRNVLQVRWSGHLTD